jgi:heptose-I-phosphate ethanolaminephosphotransferase
MQNQIKNEIFKNQNYILVSILISILTIIPQFLFSPSFEHSCFLIVTLFILLIVPTFSKIVFASFIIFLNITNIFIGHIAIHWGYSQADITSRIEAAVLSPAYETFEYLNTYLDYKDLILGFYSIGILFMLYRFLISFTHAFKVVKLISISLFAIIIIAISFYKNPIKTIEPFSIPDKIIKIIKNKRYSKLSVIRNNYLHSIEKPVKINQDAPYDTIVVIMGESVNKNRMSIYGYDKNTTPFFSDLQNKEKNFYIFDAIAPTNQTRYSVPIILTKAHVHNFLHTYIKSPSILTDFKQNSYKTYWISNQGRIGKYDSSISSIADEANTTIYANLSYSRAKTDKVVLKYLDNIRQYKARQMYLIHLIGSHGSYDKRYTKEISLFKHAKNISQAYDNTIFYTDYILKQIFDRFKNNKLLLIYTSDHGEVVSEKIHGHGYRPPYKDEYNIPLIIYSSIKNDRLDKLYQENKKRYFNTENLNYMVEYLAYIRSDVNISSSNTVFALDPKSFFKYDSLKSVP